MFECFLPISGANVKTDDVGGSQMARILNRQSSSSVGRAAAIWTWVQQA